MTKKRGRVDNTGTVRAWFLDNTMVVELKDLKDAFTDLPVTTADVVAELRNKDGTVVTESDIVLDHIADGTYRGAEPFDLALAQDTEYDCVVTAEVSGERGVWTVPVVGTVRLG